MIQQTSKRGPKKIISDYGLGDFYKYYTKNSKEPVDSKTYSKVISLFNLKIIDNIINNYKVYTVPILRLKIGVRKAKPKIRIINGILVNGNPVDWVTTKKLWDEDEESMKNKVLVRSTNRHTFGYVFKIVAIKFAAKFKNKAIFKFKASRSFQRALSTRIKDKNKEKFDSYLLYKE